MEKTTQTSLVKGGMKVLHYLILSILFLTMGNQAFAQVNAYARTVLTGQTYAQITGGTVINTNAGLSSGMSNDQDDGAVVVTLPFTFTYDGNPFTQVTFCTNGWVGMGNQMTVTSAQGRTGSNLFSTTAPNTIVAPWFGDGGANFPTGGGSMVHGSFGTGAYAFEWRNAVANGFSETTSNYINYMVVLYGPSSATPGRIEFLYGSTTGTVNTGRYIGIENATGGTGNYLNAINGLSTSTATASAWPGDGNGYRFDPPVPCTGMPVGGTLDGAAVRYLCSGATTSAINAIGAANPAAGISYQWEESLNAGTTWANATGGTGATTVTYTPPAFAGADIQYRLKVTCSNGGGIGYSSVVTLAGQIVPATQATALTLGNSGFNAFALSWTSGSGGRRMVVVSDVAIVDPANGIGIPSYTASSTFANTGQQIVYDGTGTSVTVTGLTCGTTYFVKVYEYNRCGSNPYDTYINVTADTNVLTVPVPQVSAGIPVTNNFTGFTGSNLGVAVPGWFEAAISTTGGSVPANANPSGVTSDWTNSSNLGVTTAKINLFTNTKNAWIVSPKITLTTNSRLKFKAAITNFNSAAADSDGMQGTDDKVNVMITTDCGATWTPLYVFEAANTVSLTNALTDYAVVLSAYTGQTIQIGFQATDGPVDNTPDYDFHITNILVEELPSCDVPVVAAPSNVLKDGVTISWTAPTVGVPTGYEYAVITTETTPVSGDSTTATSVDVTGLLSSTTYYVYVRTLCTDVYSDWSLVQSFTTLCDYPDILSTTDGTVCGQGEAELAATTEVGGILSWYDAQTEGTKLGEGAMFTTPLITETTDFYVSAGTPIPNSDVTIGNGGSTSSGSGNSPYYHGWGGVKTQYIVTASELQAAGLYAGPINSVAFTITSLGTSTFNNFAVSMGTTTQSVATSSHIDGLTPVYSNAAQPLTAGVNTYTFTTPFMWDGTSNLVVQVCYSNVNTGGSSSTVQYDTVGYVCTTYTYADNQSAADICAAVTGTVNGSGGTSTTSTRAKMIINGTAICASPRVAVTATVTDAPDIDLTATMATICEGGSTDISVTSANLNYEYVWMPGNLAGATQTVSPVETTTYMVTATDPDTGCVEVGEITVTVNPVPSITTDLMDMEVCEGGVQALTFGADLSSTVLSGTGASNSVAQTTSSTLGPNPMQNYYGGAKQQWLYTAAELTAMGMQAGTEISSIALDLNTANNALALNSLKISMKNASETSFATTSSWITGMTVVKPASNYSPVVGLNTFMFTTPFVWDGTSSLAVEMTYSNNTSPSTGTNSAKFSPTSFVSTIFYRADSQTPEAMAGFTGTATATFSQRNDVTFTFGQSLEVEWAPITNLYTDAAGTVPYTGGNAAVVYTKPTAPIAYTATASTAQGCSVTSSEANITISVTPAPTADVTQTFCNSATVANLTATGDMIKWYYEATGGTALAPTTQLIDGGMYYASQTVDGCESMARFAVTAEVNITPAPTVEENVQVICNAGTVADLMATGTDVQWYTDFAGGEALDPAAELEPGIAIYFASQTIDGCESAMRAPVAVFVNVVETPMADAEQSFCGSATVADLMADEDVMWYADETGGEPLAAETALEDGMAYYASIMYEGCESAVRAEVMVTITVVPELEGETMQEIAVAEGVDATIDDIEITVADGATVMWYASMEDAMNGTNQLAPGAVLVSGNTYYAVQYIGDCSSAPFGVEVSITLGARDFESANFAYWPNPVKDVLTLSYSSTITSATVYNMLGQPVITQQINALEGTINMANLSDGTYIVIVSSESATKTIRVVKKQ